MALTITPVPDCQSSLGVSQVTKAFKIQPGLSDYPTGGYPITQAQLGLGPMYGAWKISNNSAAISYGLNFIPASLTNPGPSSPLNMLVTQSGSEVAANTDLSAAIWILEFLAAGE